MNNNGEFNVTFESSDVNFNADSMGTEESFTPSYGSTTEIEVPGPQGPPGPKGDPGYTPQKGIDYFDGKDGRDGVDGKDGYTPIKGVDYFDGKDGDVGPQGPAGYTPVKGVDYFDGAPGRDGRDGSDGAPGKDGYTPIKGVDYFDGKDGAAGSDGKDGVDGSPGSDGKDGVSPTISVTAITGGHRISIKDANGTKTVDVMDGTDGKDGSDGQAGSPGKDGSNGSDGKDGVDGVGIASVKQTTTSTADDGNNIITVTLTNGQTATFTVQNGSKGSAGKDGVDGKNGSDANVTATNIKSALGYDPAKQSDVTNLSEEIADLSVIVTPQMYGAVGDGVTDDTQAFRNALAENNNVFVPKGDYLITDTLDISSAKSLVSDNGQRATVLYDGSSSIINIGRLSMFRNINITVKNAFNGIVFDTNNNNKSFSSANLGARIEHVNVKFNTESPNATVIGITVDSGTDVNNKPKLTGICFQKYNDIHVAGAYGYGIKMELIQGRAFTEETKDGFPWITHIVFNDIFLDGAKTAIKSTVTNTSGNEPFNRIGVGNVLFNNVSTQYWSADKTKIFFDLNNFAGYFTKCIGWDYHPLTWAGEKVNIIGENVSACITDCAMDFGAEFLDTCDFTAETEYTATDNPQYFMDKYFKGTILSKGYDSINAKIDAKMTAEYIGNIADEKINDVLYSGYFNVLDDPLTKYKFGVRFSNSSQQWSTETSKMAIIIPIVQGGNIIRWNPDTYTLSIGYASLFFFNDDELTSGVLVGEHTNLWVSEGNGGYLMVDNPSGYKYVSIPFERNDNVSAETMTMTINREINGVNEKSYTEYLREDVINPAVEKEVQDYAQPKGDYALKTEIPTKTSQLTNDSKFITADDIPESQDLSGYAKKSDAETWTFTLKNGTTVTKKVVLG